MKAGFAASGMVASVLKASAPLRILLVAYYLMPAVVAVTWLAVVGGRAVVVAIGALVRGGIALAAAIVVLVAPVRAGVGPWASIVAGSVALAGGSWLGWDQRRSMHAR